MPGEAGRNLVVCCDGTSNEIGTKLSNVLKLYRVLNKDETQITYYHPGIGTVAMPNSWGKWRQKVRAGFEMATGKGLDRDVLNAYCFLCRHYREGDNIYLFGFSRGAYTARVVAGMIYLIGLLREHQTNFAGYALRAYKKASASDDYAIARQFNRVVNGQCVPIRFLGVWDTVASVIVPGRMPFSRLRLEELPFTTHNPAVEVFRHAIAIDEFRRMFRIERWQEPQTFQYNPHSKREVFQAQDIRQVWFAGCHSDVGGGFVEDESALSKFPLIWMLDQARAKGLKARTQMINHIARGHIIPNRQQYKKPDPNGQLHTSLTVGWKAFEWFPKSVRNRDWQRRRAFLGLYVPWGEPRAIPEHSLVHHSVVARIKPGGPGYTPVNLPIEYVTEFDPVPTPRKRSPTKKKALGPGIGTK